MKCNASESEQPHCRLHSTCDGGRQHGSGLRPPQAGRLVRVAAAARVRECTGLPGHPDPHRAENILILSPLLRPLRQPRGRTRTHRRPSVSNIFHRHLAVQFSAGLRSGTCCCPGWASPSSPRSPSSPPSPSTSYSLICRPPGGSS